jgi:septal ring factor EnvC (AmiA/AmiB activator)
MVDELRCGLIEAETREGMQESYAKDLAAELEGLRKENAELTKDVAVMSANEASYQKEIDELRAKLADTEKDRDAYVIELEQMRAELAETEARLLSIGAIDKPTQ